MDDAIIRPQHHVVGAFTRWRGHTIAMITGRIADLRGGGEFEVCVTTIGRESLRRWWHGPWSAIHVAILTGGAFLASWRVFPLRKCRFDTEAIRHIHVVTGSTDSGCFEDGKLQRVRVHQLTDLTLLCHQTEVSIGDGLLEILISRRPINWCRDRSMRHADATAAVAKVPIYPMANHTADSLDHNRSAQHRAGKHLLLTLHPDRAMTADAKITIGPRGPLRDESVQ